MACFNTFIVSLLTLQLYRRYLWVLAKNIDKYLAQNLSNICGRHSQMVVIQFSM